MSSNSASCFYSILGINPSASEEVIRKAYKKRALEWHPDKNLSNPGAERLFQVLQKAYETLSNEESKQKYDATRSGDDNEDVLDTNLLKLQVHNCLSNMYRAKIDKWIEEYPSIKFVDNYEEELSSIILSTLSRYETETENSVDQCFVCQEFVHNKNEHIQMKNNDYLSYLAMYANDFNAELSRFSPKGWDWQPIAQAPSIYRQLWESSEWETFVSIVEKMSTVHNTFASTDNTDRVFYETLQEIDPHTEQIAAELASSKVLTTLPNVTNLKNLIDSENGTYLSPNLIPSMSRSSKDQEYREYGKICIVHDDNHPVLKHLFYDVPNQPFSYTANTKESKCSNCHMKLHFFNEKHHCRMCCKLACRKCLLWQTCRHIGYLFPVVICKACTETKVSYVINAISHHVQRQVELERYEYLAEYLALLKAYEFNDDAFYELVARRLLSNRQFTLALRYADHIHQSENDWFLLADTMVHMNACDEAATCFHIISRQFKRRTQYWISLGDTHLRQKVNSSTGFDPIKLAVLAYRQADLSYDGILRKAISESDANTRRLLVRYVAHMNKQTSYEWRTDGKSRLIKQYRRSIGICCLHLARLSIAEWASVLEELIDTSEYVSAATLLRTLSTKMVENIMLDTSPVVRFFCEEANKTELPMIDRLKFIVESKNTNNILVIAALVHLKNEDCVWDMLKEQYLSEPKQYDKVLICHKIQVELNLTTSLDWIDQGILENNSITFDLKDSAQCNWLEIGYKHLQMTNYHTALNCYFTAVRGSLADRTASFEHILSLIPDLPDDIALWYAIAVYKKAQDIFSVVCDSVQHISKILNVSQHFNRQFILSALHYLNMSGESMHSSLVAMNLNFLTGFSTYSKEFVGGLHFLETSSTSNRQVATLRQQYDDYIYVRDYEKVQRTMNVSIVELAMCLKQITSVNALKNFMNEYCDNLSISCFPSLTQAMLYLIDATISKLEGKYDGFVQKLQQVLVCSSHHDVLLALVVLTKDPFLLKMGIQTLLSELPNLPTSGTTKARYLVMPIASPPNTFAYDDCLKPNRFVTLIHHYEKGIKEQMSMNPFQSAMAYIDLCQTVSDKTCIASNWILACLHLYKGLSNMGACSEHRSRAYAYRNLINELATNAFLLAREYLTPYTQMYIYKLVLSLIVHTNRLFSQLIKPATDPEYHAKIEFVFSSQQTVITNQVLKYIFNFVKLLPIMQLQPLLTYDVIFIELLGLDFLRTYLKIMAEDNSNDQAFFYQYYLLEGVWDGWIVDRNFELARQQSMKSLLAEKHWNVSDIERLLNNTLIPRTPDGWLYSQRKSLALLGRKHYAKVDGIKFNFNTGEVTFLFVPARYPRSTTLFDSDDIADVFTKGITKAIITLDQPDQEFLSHPFQEMKYVPASLTNTKYLITLLHTDYLLKFITTGMEVNSKWPFPMRLASEGFMKRLPKRLQDLLKPLQMRDKLFSRGHIHRFWIEAGDPVYECVVDKKTNEVIYRISDVPMYVKQHLMKYDGEGKLIDDIRFDGEPDHSREAQFAKAFTDNYNEIGAYFPEFLRLKELTKLGILLNFVRHRHESLKENIAEDKDVQFICKTLCNIRRDLKYPNDTEDNVKHVYQEILRENNVSSYDVPYDKENDLKKSIRSNFEEADNEIVESITEIVCKFCCSTQKTQVKSLVDDWLHQSSAIAPVLWSCKRHASVKLVSFIRHIIIDHRRLLMNAIEKLNVSLEVDHCSNLDNDNRTCSWVPAVFMNKCIGQSRVYGGVCLLPEVEPGRVKPNPQACSHSAAIELSGNNRQKSSNQLFNQSTHYNGQMHTDDDNSVGGDSIRSNGYSFGLHTYKFVTNDHSCSTSGYSSDTDGHAFSTYGEIENTSGYDDNREKERESQYFKEPETEYQQYWLTVFLRSNSTGNNLFAFGAEHSDLDASHENTHIFDNAVDCLDYLSSVDNGYVLVVVTDEYANDKQTLIKLQESLPVSVIYRKIGGEDQRPLYTDKELKDICPKLQGSFTNINPLSYQFANASKEVFNVFSPNNTQTSTRSLNEESVTFIWYQIMMDLLLSFASTSEAKTDFFAECRQLSIDDSNRLKEIDQLRKPYQARKALTYYVKHGWFYELINKALRIQNVSSIFRLRMGIVDLNKQMLTMQTKDTSVVTLYRGQKIANNEIERLRGNINGLLSFNSFLSTSKNKAVAMMFADIDSSESNSDRETSVIFEMTIVGNLFSDISKISQYPDEEECLFMTGTIFKIVSVVKIELHQKHYWNIQLLNPHENDLDELKRIKKQFQERIAINNSPFQLQWGRFLYHIGEYDAAANHYDNWLKSLENIGDNELLATIHNDLGLIYFERKDYIRSNEHHSLAIAQAQTAPFPMGFSVFYGNQGGAQMELKDYSKALDMYRRALDIEQRRKPNNELNIGRLYSNMGAVHYCLRQFSMALGCFQAAFKLQKQISLLHATDLAVTCNNLGNIYKKMNDDVEAEKFYSEAYKIARRSLPEGHRIVKRFENNWKTSRERLENMEIDVQSTTAIEISYPTGRRNSNISISQIKIES